MTEELKKRIASLSPAKRALFEQHLKSLETEEAQSQPITPIKGRDSAELSFAQQRLWFLYRMDPNSPFYNISSAWRLRGPLDVDALKNSLNIIIQRHEALRTTFSMREGDPVQLIAPSLSLPLPVIDLRDLPDTQRDIEVQRLLTEEARQSFQLEKGPLLSAKLLRLEKQQHVFVLVIHHIISDGWSMGVLMREMSKLYEALTAGQPDPLPALPIQYADFAQWQRKALRGELLDEQLRYWEERLAGAAPVLELPTDRPRPAVQSFNGTHDTWLLDDTVADGLKRLGQQEKSTLFMTLLAAFQMLLRHYTRQQDIVVGSPIAGRQQQQTEGLIGFFVNTLALRTNLSGDPTFRELLGEVRETTLEAYAHQDLPFEKVVEELKPERSLSYSPLFQIMFVLENASTETLHLKGLDIQRVGIDSGVEKFDLTVFAEETAKGLRFLWSYNTDIYNPDTVKRMTQRMTRHYQVLLEQIVEDPDKPISEYDLLTAEERRQLLFDWNATATVYPKDQCIPQLFEAQVARRPEAVAVIHEDRQLSYAELNARANRLAHYLIAQGVGADTLVALCLERSPELVVAVLGILKAGGAYVPLDPGYPAERLAFMLEDTRAPVLITQASLQAALPPHDATVLALDNADALAGYAEANPPLRTQPRELAYVIYTSGSTGQPKGVEISHRSLINLVTWHQRRYALSPEDRTTLLAGPAFDASVWEIWPTLTAGASLYVPNDDIRMAPDRLVGWYADKGITLSFLPTPLATALLEQDLSAGLSLRTLLTGGEALHLSSTKPLPFTLVNHYGPTESTVVTTAATVSPSAVPSVTPRCMSWMLTSSRSLSAWSASSISAATAWPAATLIGPS